MKRNLFVAFFILLAFVCNHTQACTSAVVSVSLCFHNSGRPSGVILPDITADVFFGETFLFCCNHKQ